MEVEETCACRKIRSPESLRRTQMQTIDEVSEHCRDVGKGIEKVRLVIKIL